jgi:hypothetical protein
LLTAAQAVWEKIFINDALLLVLVMLAVAVGRAISIEAAVVHEVSHQRHRLFNSGHDITSPVNCSPGVETRISDRILADPENYAM